MNKNPIPEWATKPGTTVILEPGTHRRGRTFYTATITRVTKSSVFVKIGEDGRERRFVTSGWINDTERMVEYGNSDSWSPNTYIWNPSNDGIAKAAEDAKLRSLELAVANAAKNLAEVINSAERQGQDYTTRIVALRSALADYEAGNAHWDEDKK